MDIWAFIATCIGLLLLAGLIVPWVNWYRINKMTRQLQSLTERLERLAGRIEQGVDIASAPEVDEVAETSAETVAAPLVETPEPEPDAMPDAETEPSFFEDAAEPAAPDIPGEPREAVPPADAEPETAEPMIAELAPSESAAPSAPITKDAPKPPSERIAQPAASVDDVLDKLLASKPQSESKSEPEPPRPAPPKPERKRKDIEQQFGSRLFVWLGGIALALAGFFLVKYSIEQGLLSPTVRVVLGGVFGLCLLYAADMVRGKPNLADGVRISQALSGAGIAVLYVSLFAATTLYDLLPSYVGLVGMAAVTAGAVLLSLRFGLPIALLGLVGGFVTPLLIGSRHPQASVLFIYLFLVVLGMMAVVRRQRWWVLSIPTVIGALVWVLAWLVSEFTPSDSIWLGLFLIAVSATVVISSHRQYLEGDTDHPNWFRITSILNYLTMAGALGLMSLVADQADYGLMEWGLYGLIAIGGIVLAFLNQRLYGLVPWIAMAVNAAMLASWGAGNGVPFAQTLGLFGALYVASGYILQSRSERPLIWTGLVVASSIGYYLLAYFELRHSWLFTDIPLFWGGLALVLFCLAVYALRDIIVEVPREHPQKPHLLALYAATCTAFLSIALSIELPREFLSVAFSAELCAIAWLYTRLEIKALRPIAGILAGVFGFLLLPQILLLVQLSAYSLVEVKLALQEGIPIVDWPAFQLGVPAVFFVLSAYLLRRRKDGALVRIFELSAIALIGVMGYYLTRHVFHVASDVLFVKAGFFERGVITNVLFAYGIACLWIAERYTRPAVTVGGIVLCCVAVFRICYFDCITYNPLWASQNVGAYPIVNALLLTYGLPILWTWRAMQYVPRGRWDTAIYGFMLLLAFLLISLEVRQAYQGELLNGGPTGNAEVYAYSVAWLVFGIGLLLFGALRKARVLRFASLVVMILAVAKVFLYDASELEGLFRVFSFFGLGLSLLGLSWFYSKYVFGERDLLEGLRKKADE